MEGLRSRSDFTYRSSLAGAGNKEENSREDRKRVNRHADTEEHQGVDVHLPVPESPQYMLPFERDLGICHALRDCQVMDPLGPIVASRQDFSSRRKVLENPVSRDTGEECQKSLKDEYPAPSVITANTGHLTDPPG